MSDDQGDCSDCPDCAQFAAERDRLLAEANDLESNDLPRLQRERDGALSGLQGAIDRAAAAESVAQDAVNAAQAALTDAQQLMGQMTGQETGTSGDAVRALSAKQDKATRAVAAAQARIDERTTTLADANAKEIQAQKDLSDAQAAYDAAVETYTEAISELTGRIDQLRLDAESADAKYRECCAACHKAKSRSREAFVGAALMALLGVIFIGIGANAGSATTTGVAATSGTSSSQTETSKGQATAAGSTLTSAPTIIGGSVCVSDKPPPSQGPTSLGSTPGSTGGSPSSQGPTTPGATPGATSTGRFVTVNIVTNPDANGIWVARLNMAPSSVFAGTGHVVGGVGSFTLYNPPLGTYRQFTVVDTAGQIVSAGALAPLFPYIVSVNNQPCQQVGATAPGVASSSTSSTSAAPTASSTVEQSSGGGANWGFLIGGLGLVVGAGVMGETGRRLRMHGIPDDTVGQDGAPEDGASQEEPGRAEEVPATVATDGAAVTPTADTAPGQGEEFEDKIFGAMGNLARVRGLRHEYDEEAPDPSQPIILANKGKLYNDIQHDRAAAQAIVKEEKDSITGSVLNFFGWNRTINYAQTVIARCDDEQKDFDEREKVHGTVGAANLLWDEREQQWSTYRWAIWNCFAVPVAGAFGGYQASGGNVLGMLAQIFGNLSQTPDEVVEWMTGEDPAKSGGVPWRKVFGVAGVTFGIGSGLQQGLSGFRRPPKIQVRVPRSGVAVKPPPEPAAPGSVRRVAPVPPPQRGFAPVPHPIALPRSPQYQAEHQTLKGRLGNQVAGLNLGNAGSHWAGKRNVNCPYTSLYLDQLWAGKPLRGIPPFHHTDGIGMLENWYQVQLKNPKLKFQPITAAGLEASLQAKPGARGIVYVRWQNPGTGTNGGAHVFNVISVQGKEGVHVYVVDAQNRQVNPRYFRQADPTKTMVLWTTK
jgi:hypothetical protein